MFGVFKTRKREALKELIGDYSGIVINCDRAKMYYDGKTLQWCWAHLKRDIQKLIDNPDHQVKRLGNDLMKLERLLFEHWRAYQDKQKTWRGFQLAVAPIRKSFTALMLRGCFSGNSELIGFCESLNAHNDWLWTFTKVQGIEPTNNAAERALRPAVIYRKLSFGTQSSSGSRFIERMLTVTETCRLQNRSTFEFMVEAVEAHYNKTRAPTLLRKKRERSRRKVA